MRLIPLKEHYEETLTKFKAASTRLMNFSQSHAVRPAIQIHPEEIKKLKKLKPKLRK
jgi:hypothetical protein